MPILHNNELQHLLNKLLLMLVYLCILIILQCKDAKYEIINV